MYHFNKEEVLADFKNWHAMIRQYQIPNTRKAVIQIVNSFSFYVGLWVLQYFLFDYSIWFTILIAILNGFLLGRIFIIQHDCGHRSFTSSQTANSWIGTISSFFTFIPFKYWAKSHDFHHAHNAQLEHSDVGDIECLTVEEYAAKPWYKRAWYRVYRNPLYLFTVGGFVYVVIYNRFSLLKTAYFEKVKNNVALSNLLFLLVYGALAIIIGPKKFLLVQFINLFFFGTYALWFFYIQHQYEETYKSSKENWNYVVSAIKGSTFYNLPKVGHWLTGNIGFHHIHHLSPAIPNYNLEKCHRENPLFEKHVNKMSFWQSLKTINANLWDEEQQKMISFGEYKKKKFRFLNKNK
jgi:omega-6 fatty acid desaturase (delta-12 desaturase)